MEFSPEDAGRSDPDFVVNALEQAIAAGATTLNIPDTVGYSTPAEFGELIAHLIAHTPGAGHVVWSVHCHNDLGLATANTLAGVTAGARQVEVTINGIGEHAGNTSLEEVVMALHTRPQVYHLHTNIDTTQIIRTSRMVSAYTGLAVQPNKAIVGANAFAHEAGIHQDGMLKNSLTYEIMRPETVGLVSSRLVLGKHSGRHALRARLEELGYGNLDEHDINLAFDRFKRLADEKKVVADPDIEAIIVNEVYQPARDLAPEPHPGHLRRSHRATATVSLTGPDEKVYEDAALGTGPVDAVYEAINRIVGVANTLSEFSIKAITAGMDAVGEVTIRIQTQNGASEGALNLQTGEVHLKTFSGHGASTDIIVASARAYISALNKLLAAQAELQGGVAERPRLTFAGISARLTTKCSPAAKE